MPSDAVRCRRYAGIESRHGKQARMAEIRKQTFTAGATVETDGNTFIDCKFDSASLQYSGGPHPFFQNCESGDIGWYFAGPALRTIQLLQQINSSEAGAKLIADLFRPGNYIGE